MSETRVRLTMLERPSLSARLESIRAELIGFDADATIDAFELADFDRLLKTTISLCHACLRHVPAVVYVVDGRVLMRKRCPDHGLSDALLENDEAFYHLSNRDRWGRRFDDRRVVDLPEFTGCCGGEACCDGDGDGDAIEADHPDVTPQMANKTCTVLVEVTNACNLACPVCYSDARGDRKLPFDDFTRHLRELIKRKGGLDSVQLTGGEAILHPEFWRMVAFLYDEPGVNKIYLPTNGIAFVQPDVAAKLAPFRDRVMVLLQFDGQTRNANRAMRDADTTRLRERVLDNLAELDIQTQLTMTITRGVNDDEVGWVIDTGMKRRHVKVVALQPVTYSGRYDLTQDPMQRMTLSDVVKAVAEQVRRRTATDDFVPIPCSHPNCGWITLYVRRLGLTVNIVRHVDVAAVMGRVANRTLLKTDELRGVIGTRGGLLTRIGAALGRRLVRSTDVFGVAIKPFMDRFSYDQDRVSACCHHLLDTRGRPVSFCEYNALTRVADPWDGLPPVAEVEP
ncbi:MAG: radical SAM protein [Phycisphaera sp.]|nr:radical SAM protein [Phycisphaera sp.]